MLGQGKCWGRVSVGVVSLGLFSLMRSRVQYNGGLNVTLSREDLALNTLTAVLKI